MTWSYSASITTSTDRVRLLFGDTDTTDQQLSNEEIGFLITVNGSVTSAAAAACDVLAAKYTRFSDKWVGDLKILASQKAKAYLELAKTLRERGAAYAVPTAGGVYVAEKETNAENEALVQPTFTRGLHENTGD